MGTWSPATIDLAEGLLDLGGASAAGHTFDPELGRRPARARTCGGGREEKREERANDGKSLDHVRLSSDSPGLATRAPDIPEEHDNA